MTEPSEQAYPDEQPPEGYIPQTPLQPDFTEGIYERESDLIADAEAEEVTDAEAVLTGVADDDDDDFEDDE